LKIMRNSAMPSAVAGSARKPRAVETLGRTAHGTRRTAASWLALALLFAAGPARAATVLHLSASATVRIMPDRLGASLVAEAARSTPVEAQAAVNLMVRQALATARAVSSVTTSTGSYSVWYVADPHPQWRANQALILTGTDGPALLGLVGRLQGDGLAVSDLAWSLAPKTAAAAHDKAEALALAALKGKAERAAKLLGMSFVGFRQVWLNPEGLPVQPMAMMAARAVPPPSAVPAESSVTATVTAEADLEK